MKASSFPLMSSSWRQIFLLALSLGAALCRGQVTAQTGMTADAHCGDGYCFTAVYIPEAKQINYTLVVPSTNGPAAGWYGIGTGTGMRDSNMAINWANADGSVTTSHRSADGEEYPTEEKASSLPQMTLNAGVSTTSSSQTIWSWNFAQEEAPSSRMAHMYAHSPQTPQSSASGGGIGMHTSYETPIMLDMTKPYNGEAPAGLVGATSPTVAVQSSTSDRDLSQARTRLFLVHMIFMVLGWMLFVPLGIFIARFGRSLFTWFPTHRAVQSGATLFIIIGVILAIAATAKDSGGDASGHFQSAHAKSGIGLFVLLLLQIILGFVSHTYRAKTGKRWLGYIHMPLGVALVVFSLVTISLGFDAWTWRAPNGAKYFLFAWAALLAVIYIAGLFLIPKQRRREQSKQEKKKNDQLEAEKR